MNTALAFTEPACTPVPETAVSPLLQLVSPGNRARQTTRRLEPVSIEPAAPVPRALYTLAPVPSRPEAETAAAGLKCTLRALFRPPGRRSGWAIVPVPELLAMASKAHHGLTTMMLRLSSGQAAANFALVEQLDEIAAEFAAWRAQASRLYGSRPTSVPQRDAFVLDTWLDLRREALRVMLQAAVAIDADSVAIDTLHGELEQIGVAAEVAAAHLRTVHRRVIDRTRTLPALPCLEFVRNVLDELRTSAPARCLRATNLDLLARLSQDVVAEHSFAAAVRAADPFVVFATWKRVCDTLELLANDEQRASELD
jgi:hypothetical protein